MLLSLLLIFPSVLFAKEKTYFLACKDVNLIDENFKVEKHFERGALFDASAAYSDYRPKGNVEVSDRRSGRKGDFGAPTELKVYYGWAEKTIPFKLFGWVNLSSGCWFKSQNDISEIIPKGFFKGYYKGYDGDELFKKPLDKKFVDIMCSPHSTQFSVDGNMFTDITMEKTEEYLHIVEKNRQEQEAKNEKIRQDKEAEEERIQKQRQEENRILQDKREKLLAELKKYGAEALVQVDQLEVNPYEFEDHTIAVVVQFKRMLSRESAAFYSGYTDLERYTGVYDEIIVTGIPRGTHFETGLLSPRMMLVLKGKGTTSGTNAFGAKIKAPYYQWIGIISGRQPSVLEEQRDVSRKNALQNEEAFRKQREMMKGR